MLLSVMRLPRAGALSESAARAASRVRCNESLEQSGALASRSFAKDAVPFGEGLAKILAMSSQIAKLGLDVREFASGKRANAMAGRFAAIALAENGGQLLDGKAERQRSANQANAREGMRRKEPVARSGARRGGKQAATLIVAERVGTDTREPSEFAGIERMGCGGVRSHGESLRVGMGSRVKGYFSVFGRGAGREGRESGAREGFVVAASEAFIHGCTRINTDRAKANLLSRRYGEVRGKGAVRIRLEGATES